MGIGLALKSGGIEVLVTPWQTNFNEGTSNFLCFSPLGAEDYVRVGDNVIEK